jgi:hypothetical protein
MALVVAMALVPVREEFGGANVAIVLVIIIIAAAAGGRLAGGVTGLVAAMAFNFLHTEPYLSLRIHAGRDVFTVVLLVVVGLIVGQLAQVYGGTRKRSEQRLADGEVLERVARLVAEDAPAPAVWEAVRAGLIDVLHLADCRFEPGPEAGRVHIGRSGRILANQLEFAGDGFALPPEGAELPVVFAGERIGGIMLVPRPHEGSQREDRRMAVARNDLFASATHAVRPRWAAVVSSKIRCPACPALRPRQRLQRSRHSPRLLVPSRSGNTVGRCSIHLTRLNRFTYVRACRSLYLRFVVVVASHNARLDSCWLAGPWQERNCTSWMDEASPGRTPGDAVKEEA